MKKIIVVVVLLALVTMPLVACGYQRSISIDLSDLNSELSRLQGMRFGSVNIPGINIGGMPRMNMGAGSWLRWIFFPVFSLWRMLVAVVLGWLAFTLFPVHTARTSAAAEKEPLRAILYGLLGYLATVPATIVLAITLIGIPLIPVLWIAVYLAGVFGQAAIGIWVGRALNKSLNQTWNETHQVLIGLAVIAFATSIPGAGGLVGLFTGLLAFGATVWTQFGRNAVV